MSRSKPLTALVASWSAPHFPHFRRIFSIDPHIGGIFRAFYPKLFFSPAVISPNGLVKCVENAPSADRFGKVVPVQIRLKVR
jgi:hypothetical protein